MGQGILTRRGGGATTSNPNGVKVEFQHYTAQSETWEKRALTPMLNSYTSAATCAAFDGKVVYGEDEVEMYDVKTGVRTALEPIKYPRKPRSAATKGKVLFAGALTPGTTYGNQLDAYDVATGAHTTGNVKLNFIYQTVAGVCNTFVLAYGQTTNSYQPYTKAITKIDATTLRSVDGWLTVERFNAVSATTRDQLFLAGGRGKSLFDTVEVLDGIVGTISVYTPLSNARACDGAAASDGKVIFVGGDTQRTVDLFDVDLGARTTLEPATRSAVSVAAVKGKAIIAGGQDQTSQSVFNTVELYDLNTGEKSTMPPLTSGKAYIMEAGIDDKVIFAGGNIKYSPVTYTNTVEQYQLTNKVVIPTPIGSMVSIDGGEETMMMQNELVTDAPFNGYIVYTEAPV